MSIYYDLQKNEIHIGRIVCHVGISILTIVIIAMGGCPKYSVWQQGQVGQAALARATQDRQIAVQEATAKMEASKMLAQAEVERAKGVAAANKIIGDSLHNNEDYLRYLFVNNLEHTQNQVIYIPTEANMPILEAGRKPSPKPVLQE